MYFLIYYKAKFEIEYPKSEIKLMYSPEQPVPPDLTEC